MTSKIQLMYKKYLFGWIKININLYFVPLLITLGEGALASSTCVGDYNDAEWGDIVVKDCEMIPVLDESTSTPALKNLSEVSTYFNFAACQSWIWHQCSLNIYIYYKFSKYRL